MGDVTITLPYLQHLRNSLPASTKIDFLTRKECDDIPKNILLFNKVISIAGGRNFKWQLLHTFFLLPGFLLRHYDVVIDLQNNDLSELVRKSIRPKAWSVFDRFTSRAAGERTRLTIEAIGLGENQINPDFKFKRQNDSSTILRRNGWNGTNNLVVLNPASAFMSRNWPLENYAAFAEELLKLSPLPLEHWFYSRLNLHHLRIDLSNFKKSSSLCTKRPKIILYSFYHRAFKVKWLHPVF